MSQPPELPQISFLNQSAADLKIDLEESSAFDKLRLYATAAEKIMTVLYKWPLASFSKKYMEDVLERDLSDIVNGLLTIGRSEQDLKDFNILQGYMVAAHREVSVALELFGSNEEASANLYRERYEAIHYCRENLQKAADYFEPLLLPPKKSPRRRQS